MYIRYWTVVRDSKPSLVSSSFQERRPSHSPHSYLVTLLAGGLEWYFRQENGDERESEDAAP